MYTKQTTTYTTHIANTHLNGVDQTNTSSETRNKNNQTQSKIQRITHQPLIYTNLSQHKIKTRIKHEQSTSKIRGLNT